ncbi:FAD-dependent oxidoreductase [Proteiniphilum sp.]|uniref:FAD-dependent oxidoreductase n=1 Tax=Proteiniphilum sp. TaxID=1926877 RepID=UPI00332446FA
MCNDILPKWDAFKMKAISKCPPRSLMQYLTGRSFPKNECDNLLVTYAISSSHIAFGSIRMEPVFMIMGQSAATAASIAIDQNTGLHDVDYAVLRERLLSDNQKLDVDTGKYPPFR